MFYAYEKIMGLLIWTAQKQGDDSIIGEFAETTMASPIRNFDVFLCCPGPSLKDVDPAKLRVPGAIIFAVNTAYPKVRPDVWIGMDAAPCYDSRLPCEPFIKVWGSLYRDSWANGRQIKLFPNTYFATGQKMLPWEIFQHLNGNSPFIWQQDRPNTFFTAMHLAIWMGARRIFLCGVDLGGSQDYHDDRKLDDAARERNRNLYTDIGRQMLILQITARYHGVDIISCTPDSPLNEGQGGNTPYVSIDEAVKMAAQHGAKADDPAMGGVLDARLAQLCEWSTQPPKAPKGVMIALDAGMEWLLDWWWENYSTHNHYPVCFVDYGLSANGLAWCQKHAFSLLQMEQPPPILNHLWFRKPFALLNAPFERTAFMEPDCEVKGDIGPIFEACSRGLALTMDPHNPWSKEYLNPPLATGVIGVQRGDGLVCAWAKAILTGGAERRFRSDQEALNLVVSQLGKDGVVVMPKEFQWLRLDGDDNGKALIYHWTGPDGKAAIAAKIGAKVSAPVEWRTDIPMTGMYPYLQRFVAEVIETGVQGDFAEIGVLAGETFIPLAAEAAKAGRIAHAVDSFRGMGKPLPQDGEGYPEGRFDVGGPGELQSRLDALGLRKATRVHAGFVPSILTELKDSRFAFVHIDLDHYLPTKQALNFVWERMSPGGVMICHDYFPEKNQLASLAYKEWQKENGLCFNGPNETHHGWLLKPKIVLPSMPIESMTPPAPPPRVPEVLVSILMAAYNAEKYIGYAIESCLKQTHANWELVIIDDGSTDNTGQVVAGFNDQRIIYSKLPSNVGAWSAMNEAYRLCKGQLITRLDADDGMAAEKIAAQVAYLKRNPGEYVVTCEAMFMDESDNIVGYMPCAGQYDIERYVRGGTGRQPANAPTMARRCVWDAAGPWSGNYRLSGDAEWNLNVIKAGWRSWGHIAKPLYQYRRHAESMGATEGAGTLDEFKALLLDYRKWVESHAEVAIVMPAHDAHRYIGLAAGSCIQQSYPNWRLYIVDDGSTSETEQIIKKINHPNIILYRTEHHGYVSAFNTALVMAMNTGKYIARLDADDVMHKDRIRLQVEALAGKFDVATCDMTWIDEDGIPTVVGRSPGMCEAYFTGDLLCGPGTPTILATREAYRKIGPMEGEDQAADADWNFRAAGLRWIHVTEPLYYYRKHSGQMTSGDGPARQQQRYRRLVEEYKKTKDEPCVVTEVRA